MMKKQSDQLKILSIFHYIVGGLLALFSCFPIFHLIMGLVFLINPGGFEDGDPEVLRFVGVIFVLVALFIIILGWSLAITVAIAGRKLARRESYMFCLVVAGVECLFMPIGTALGVFTIINLTNDDVKAEFEKNAG